MIDEVKELIEKGMATMCECYHCQNWVGGCTQKVTLSELMFVDNVDPEIRRVREYKMMCPKFKTMG